MKNKAIVALVVAAVIGAAPILAQRPAAATQTGGGSISGSVLSLDSVPISGALVVLSGTGGSGNSVFLDSTSNKTGQFVISGLPPGAYTACVHAEQGTTSVTPIQLLTAGLPPLPAEQVHYLDSCSAGQTITVASGASQTVNFRLQRGMPVTVILHDPNAVLSASGASMPSMSLVDATGTLQAALEPHRVVDGTVRYSALVPIGTVYRLSITPNGLTLRSTSLGAVPSTGTSVFSAPASAVAAFTTGAREVIIGEFTL